MCFLSSLAQGYKEITSSALLNPSFELKADGQSYTAAIAKTVTGVYGWQIPTPQEQSIADETSTEVGFTNGAGGVKASQGRFFFWNRKGWGSATGTLSTTTNTLEAGKYYVEFYYKAADYSNNNNHSQSGTTMQLMVNDENGSNLVSTTIARRSFSMVNNSSNPGDNTYMKDSPWVPMGTFFIMDNAGKAVITVVQNMKNNGRSDICYDNFRLFRIYDSGDMENTAFPLDVTGTIANPSFEAGATGSDWAQYSYNGWNVAKAGGEIKATSAESYVSVYGDKLHGRTVFNAWDNSSTTNKKLSQSVGGLPLGNYRLTATVTGYTGNSFSLFADNTSKMIIVESGDAVQTEILEFTKTKNSAIEIGVNSDVFFKADNFRLEYMGCNEDAEPDDPEQVKTAVSITTAVDYTIASVTPFTTTGSVDICNPQATVIFPKLKPSVVIDKWLSFVKVNGQLAANGQNCQVRMYNNGAVIFPYGDDCQPLTVYSDAGCSGTSCSDFGLGNTGGYMNTMTDQQLNNRVRSFRLKRGYMVTFSLQPEGRGYSRCFIADKADIEVNLPQLMAGRVSSYRIFKWNNAPKKGIASTTDRSVIGKINAAWAYAWGVGEDLGPDVECVPHHLYEDWPSSAECGRVTYSPHMKTNNEPLNSADDHPQNLATILNNWENLMRTGMRLCSPSSWDGSAGFTKQFLDSIDARGWRCDIVDMHCYWTENKFNELASLQSQYRRPLWISEFLWGASWNSNGIFASKSTEENRTVMSRILDRLNSWRYVERYAYWNSEAWYSRIVNTDDGWVTPLGDYYRDMDTGLGYDPAYEFVPTTPRQYDPTSLEGKYDPTTETLTLTWTDMNGELNQLMEIERAEGSSWTSVYVEKNIVDGKSTCKCILNNVNVGDRFRVHIIDYNGTHRYSNAFTVPYTLSKGGEPCMEVKLQGTTYFLGGNLLTNGDFDYGLCEWQNGTGSNATWPAFKTNDVAGVEGGAYLQSYSHTGRDADGALRRTVEINENSKYYFSVYSKNNDGGFQMASISVDGIAETEVVNNLSATTGWTLDGTVFDSGNLSKFIIRYRWLGSKSQFDRFFLAKLFKTRNEAVADAIAQIRKEITLFTTWNKYYPTLNEELQSVANRYKDDGDNTMNALCDALSNARRGISVLASADSLVSVARALCKIGFKDSDILMQAVDNVLSAQTTDELIKNKEALQIVVNDYMPVVDKTELVSHPSFEEESEGWTIKNGAYRGGDQRHGLWLGRSCWNAWWNLSSSEAEDKTLGISQIVKDLPMGYYSVSADAATEHYCISDQHAYISTGNTIQQSPALKYDRADIPDISDDNLWQTLTTLPLYVEQDGTATIGFESSKKGATEGAFGRDNREGWWLATNFQLQYTPAYELAIGDDNHWATICLPFNAEGDDNLEVYKIVGRTEDRKSVVMEPYTDYLEAGKPYVIYSKSKKVVFRGNGRQVEEPYYGNAPIQGLFRADDLHVTDSVTMLVNGEWRFVVDIPHYHLGNYQAYITSFDLLPVISDTSALTLLPIIGADTQVPEEEPVPDGLYGIRNNASMIPEYNLSGRKAYKYKSLRIRNGKKYIAH